MLIRKEVASSAFARAVGGVRTAQIQLLAENQ